MFDTHCHLTAGVFQSVGGPEAVLERARDDGVRGAITVSTSSSNCLDSMALAERCTGLWFSAGIHPLHAHEERSWDDVRAAGTHERCVAWGELGLDCHYDHPPLDVQRACLEEHLALVESAGDSRSGQPVIVHCRDAFEELIEVFSASSIEATRFVFHCFTGNSEDVRRLLDFGAHVSFTGIVTFSGSGEIAAASRLVPSDRIMVETDAPYLTPEPHRSVRPNEPRFVIHTAEFLARIREEDPVDFAEVLDRNAERFFGLSIPS